MKTWQIEREQVTLKTPKQPTTRNKEISERKLSSSAKSVEAKQTDDNKAGAGPFSSMGLQVNFPQLLRIQVQFHGKT